MKFLIALLSFFVVSSSFAESAPIKIKVYETYSSNMNLIKHIDVVSLADNITNATLNLKS